MQQSNAIFAFLFIAFLVFITMKGELPLYMGFLFGTSSGSGANAGGNVAGAVSGFIKATGNGNYMGVPMPSAGGG